MLVIITVIDNHTEKPMAIQVNRHERRWFWIAMMSFLGLYCQLSLLPTDFSGLTGLSEVPILGVGYSLVIASLLLSAILSKRLRLLDEPDRFRLFYLLISAVGILAYTGFVITVAIKPSAPLAIIVCQVYIALVAIAVVTGCALHRAAKAISVKQAASFSGYMVIIWLIIIIIRAVFLSIFNYFIVLYITEVFIYTAPLLISLMLLIASKQNREDTITEKITYFSDELALKLMILAVLLLLMDSFGESSYYGDGSLNNIFSLWTQIALLIIPVISGGILTMLLRNNKWVFAIAAIAILRNFEQGLIIFFNNINYLAVVYAVSSAVTSSAPIILFMFIPIVLCTQRRSSVTTVTVIISLWLLPTVVNACIEAIQGSKNVLSSITSPAASFIISLATIAFLFYLYTENNKITMRNLLEIIRQSQQKQKTPDEIIAEMKLTQREKQVLKLLLDGESLKLIASNLKITFSTVNFHTKNLYRKLNIQSRSELFSLFMLPEISEKE
jgi:DNA-binding CsgD family transcriptional regulator